VTVVLAGDVGGTNTRLAVFEATGGALSLRRLDVYPSRDHPSLDAVVADFLAAGRDACEAACFAVAGPVAGRRARTTNLPWEVDADALQARFGIARVRLLNDLEATARGIAELPESAFHTLLPGAADAAGNRAVIAAGTGLGEAGLYWDGTAHLPFASEGGHADFAPASPLETALRDHLAERHGHVSWERVVSGPGLADVHAFLAARGRGPVRPRPGRAAEDPAAVVAAARAGDPGALETVALFVRCFGAEAGNLALKLMATGGVFVAGGMAPRLLPFLRRFDFAEAFLAKGRMRPLLERMPVRVVLDEGAALLGAARAAAPTAR